MVIDKIKKVNNAEDEKMNIYILRFSSLKI